MTFRVFEFILSYFKPSKWVLVLYFSVFGNHSNFRIWPHSSREMSRMRSYWWRKADLEPGSLDCNFLVSLINVTSGPAWIGAAWIKPGLSLDCQKGGAWGGAGVSLD